MSSIIREQIRLETRLKGYKEGKEFARRVHAAIDELIESDKYELNGLKMIKATVYNETITLECDRAVLGSFNHAFKIPAMESGTELHPNTQTERGELVAAGGLDPMLGGPVEAKPGEGLTTTANIEQPK